MDGNTSTLVQSNQKFPDTTDAITSWTRNLLQGTKTKTLVLWFCLSDFLPLQLNIILKKKKKKSFYSLPTSYSNDQFKTQAVLPCLRAPSPKATITEMSHNLKYAEQRTELTFITSCYSHRQISVLKKKMCHIFPS